METRRNDKWEEEGGARHRRDLGEHWRASTTEFLCERVEVEDETTNENQ